MSLINTDNTLPEIKKLILQKLEQAGKDHRSAMREITLATVNEQGANLRTVILRSFDPAKLMLEVYTDYRSTKVDEINKNPQVTLLIYDQPSKCQIKLKGIAEIHHKDKISQSAWEKLKGGKEAYNTRQAPGTEVKSLERALNYKNEFDSQSFCLIQIKLEFIEILQLMAKKHLRLKLNLETNQSSWLVP